MVDDCVGKSFRQLIYDQYDEWVATFDPQAKLSKSSVRQLLLDWTAAAATKWNNEKWLTIGMLF
jgi:hypothetical protein